MTAGVDTAARGGVEIVGLRKRFGATEVLRGIDLAIPPGVTVGLVGANGAGKSTLVKSLSGALRPDAGRIRIGEWEGTGLTPRLAQQLGVTTIYQDPSLAPSLGLVENVVLGREATRGRVFLAPRRQVAGARRCLDRVGLTLPPGTLAGALSPAEQQLLEIAKALYRRSQLVIMDEPTAALGDAESERLFRVIDELRDEGTSIVYISHRLDEVLRLCSQVAVMRDGEKVLDTATDGLTERDLVRAMIGHDVRRVDGEAGERGDVVLELEDVGQGSRLSDISFRLHAGEVLGITGLVGSGRSRLMRVLFGIDGHDRGTMTLKGEPFRPSSPAQAIARGIGLIPEDRKRDALLMHAPAASNISLVKMPHRWLGVLDRRRERAVGRHWIERLNVHPPSLRAVPAYMSGGNQQKLVIARWAHAGADVYIFDEPCQGVDVGAKERILRATRELAAQGAAVLLVSQEVEELEQAADRVLVMRHGRITGRLERDEITEANVIALAMGTARGAEREEVV